MYFLDPQAGRGRRRRLVDGCSSLCGDTERFFGRKSRDLRNRVQGLAHEAGQVFRHEDVDGSKLLARIRSKLGRVVSHPHAIEVNVQDSRVVLSGPILAAEMESLVKTVAGMRGVEAVENRLEPHQSPEGVPALQGGASRPAAQEWH